MTLTDTLLEFLDLGSFSSVWYWIFLGWVWTEAGIFVLGIPIDVLQRAERDGGRAMEDLEALVGFHVARLARLSEQTGVFALGLGSAVFGTLVTLGFGYGMELAQALLFLVLPFVLRAALAARAAGAQLARPLSGDALLRFLFRHRFQTQAVGYLTIFLTIAWSFWQQISIGTVD